MFAYFIGKIIRILPNKINLLINSVAFEINISKRDKYILGNEVKIFVYDFIKDNRFFLYGFLEEIDLYFFKKLLEVNGIGPKKAINIIENITYKEFLILIKSRNKIALSKISGIGNKAENLIANLFYKLENISISLFEYENVFLALKNLGYQIEKINKILIDLPNGLAEEVALKEAIKRLNNA